MKHGTEMNIEVLTENYKKARSLTKDMTVGLFYSDEGQELFNNEMKALDELSEYLGAPRYEVVEAFYRNNF